MAACPFAVASRALSWTPVAILTSDLFVSLAVSPRDLGGVALISRLNISLGTYRNFSRGDLVSVTSVDGRSRRVCRRIAAVSGDEIFQASTDRNIRVPHGHVYLEPPHPQNNINNNNNDAKPLCQGIRPISLINGKVVASFPPMKPYEDAAKRSKRIYTRL